MRRDDFVLGLDSSPRRIGWAVLTGARKIVDYGCIMLPGESGIEQRADAVMRIEEREYARIAIEDVYFGQNRKVAKESSIGLGHLEALMHVDYPDAELVRLHAKSWRKLIGLPMNGKEPIKQWAHVLCEKQGQPVPKGQDECDAIGIAYAACLL